MSDDEGRENRVTSEVERNGRARLGKLLAAVLVAMPGAYAAVRTQYNADASTVTTEVVVRDRQERAFRMHFEVLRREIAAVRATSVSRKELLELVVKLRDRSEVYRPRSPARRTEATAREVELEKKLEAIRDRERRADVTVEKVEAARRVLPKLKPSAVVRRSVLNDL